MIKPARVTLWASIYLLLYCLLLQVKAAESIAMLMFFFSPLIVVWMVFVVIKHGTYTGHTFNENEEWGYQDRNKEDMGMF
jgi:fatty acid desaturase